MKYLKIFLNFFPPLFLKVEEKILFLQDSDMGVMIVNKSVDRKSVV